MAELATLPSSAKVGIGRDFFDLHRVIPPNVTLKRVKSGCKKYCYGNVKVRASSRNITDFTVDTAMLLGRSVRLKESSMRYCCFGTLVNPDNTTTFTWVPVFDQVLMVVSIGLAYIGGVVPPDKAGFNSRKMLDHGTATPSSSSGSAGKNDPQGDVEYAWVEVERKLLSVLDAVQQDGRLDEGVAESQKYVAKCPLSLSAIAEGPRLRLLWATLQQLEKEVNTFSGDRQVVDRSDWMATSLEIIQQSCQSVFLTWLEEELRLENKKHDKLQDILLTMIKRLKQDDNISKNIRKSGKEDLYADLLFFLRFHFLGIDCCYDNRLLGQHAIDVLEDLVITLADGITTSYLELISVDSNITSEMNCLGLNLCSLSTRALQKLRNEMALKQFLHQNMDSVISMYEDRFDLYSFQVQLVKESDKNKQDKLHWWKQLVVNKATPTVCSLQHIVISPLSLSVKRTKELRALSGWRYYFSLFLEFSDISMPLVKVLFAKVSSAVSFLLVSLVGRSLGLIYSGIRQSLGWR